MWVLETEGDAFQGKTLGIAPRFTDVDFPTSGKKLWLRPGKKFIFGRTQSDGMLSIVVAVLSFNNDYSRTSRYFG